MGMNKTGHLVELLFCWFLFGASLCNEGEKGRTSNGAFSSA